MTTSDVPMPIELTQGRYAFVDAMDFRWLSQNNWHFHSAGRPGYAARKEPREYNEDGTVTRETVMMHRAILERVLDRQLRRGEECDHINKDGLDNRRSNLRVATSSENKANGNMGRDQVSSRYRGVRREKRTQKWVARIKVRGKGTHLGTYENEEEAAIAYDRAAMDHFGEFATLNFPKLVAT